VGAVIIGCVVYGIQLGWGCVVSGLVCTTSSGFSSVLLFSVGGFFFLASGFHCLCVCAWLGAFGVSTAISRNLPKHGLTGDSNNLTDPQQTLKQVSVSENVRTNKFYCFYNKTYEMH